MSWNDQKRLVIRIKKELVYCLLFTTRCPENSINSLVALAVSHLRSLSLPYLTEETHYSVTVSISGYPARFLNTWAVSMLNQMLVLVVEQGNQSHLKLCVEYFTLVGLKVSYVVCTKKTFNILIQIHFPKFICQFCYFNEILSILEINCIFHSHMEPLDITLHK